MGQWNWWAPAPLARLHERFGISESGPAEPDPKGPGDVPGDGGDRERAGAGVTDAG